MKRDNRPLRSQAIEAVAKLGHTPDGAQLVVDQVLHILDRPDRFMLEGGFDELTLAMGSTDPRGARYRRDLARVIWCSMLDRAR